MKRQRDLDVEMLAAAALKMTTSAITGNPHSQHYYNLLQTRSALPVASHRALITHTILTNPITLLTGETGSGKTTQIPHYIAELLDIPGMIVCTQPRRVAAMSVAQRVAEEVGSDLGAHVGYNVRFDNRMSPSTRLAYYTDGMLLREFITDPNLPKFGAVIVDEAHERTVDTDILLGLLKDLSKRRPSLKVLVMSATLDMATFQQYFPGAPTIAVPGRVYPVAIHYATTPTASDHVVRVCSEKVVSVHATLKGTDGDILVFLPGESEIIKAIARIEDGIDEALRQDPSLMRATVLPMYGSLPLEEQARVFGVAPVGTRKIICATNIAETSLTIDGIVYVVDSCYHKQSLYNPVNRIDFLLPSLVSKASAMQRAGRAGRTRKGECYRMLTEAQYAQLADQTFPEILRCDATGTILTILRLGYASPYAFPFISAPSQSNFLDAYMHLSYLGALRVEGGSITDEGRLLSEFPTGVAAAKAIVKGASLGCSVDVLMIVAMLEAGTVLKSAFKDAASADVARAVFAHPTGDHLTLYRLFHAFIASKQSPEWCNAHYVNYKGLQQAVNIFRQLSSVMDRLKLPRNTSFVRETGYYDERLIRRALFEGYFAHTAMLQIGNPVPYKSVREQQPFTLHPSSALSSSRPIWIMFDSLEMQGGGAFTRLASIVEASWLMEVHAEFFDWTEIEGVSDDMKAALKALAV